MAFLKEANKAVTSTWIEHRNHTILGEQTRTRYRVRVMWPCDDTGGESPPSTYTHPVGGSCDLVQSAPEIGYLNLNGVYVAIYETETAWS